MSCGGGHLGFSIHTKNWKLWNDYSCTVQSNAYFFSYLIHFLIGSFLQEQCPVVVAILDFRFTQKIENFEMILPLQFNQIPIFFYKKYFIHLPIGVYGKLCPAVVAILDFHLKHCLVYWKRNMCLQAKWLLLSIRETFIK